VETLAIKSAASIVTDISGHTSSLEVVSQRGIANVSGPAPLSG